MTMLFPTKDLGAQTKPSDMLYVEPEQLVTDETLEAELPDLGLNTPFLADVMSAMLAHERCGRHLYRAAAARTNNPMLERKYNELGRETGQHVEILESLVTQMGGNPAYVSPMARAVEGMDTKLLESTYAASGALDPMTREMALLDAVFIAESVDHANWSTMAKLVEALPAGELRDAAAAACAKVEEQEDEHLGWASSTKQRLVVMQAESKLATTIGMKTEELVARVRSWFENE
jgi:rubrerythrin